MSTSVFTCHICMRELAGGVVERKLKCGHVFHRRCVDQWLEKKHTCPTCRNEERPPDPPPAPPVSGLIPGSTAVRGRLPDGSYVVETMFRGTAEDLQAMVDRLQDTHGVTAAFAQVLSEGQVE